VIDHWRCIELVAELLMRSACIPTAPRRASPPMGREIRLRQLRQELEIPVQTRYYSTKGFGLRFPEALDFSGCEGPQPFAGEPLGEFPVRNSGLELAFQSRTRFRYISQPLRPLHSPKHATRLKCATCNPDCPRGTNRPSYRQSDVVDDRHWEDPGTDAVYLSSHPLWTARARAHGSDGAAWRRFGRHGAQDRQSARLGLGALMHRAFGIDPRPAGTR
jgi:hypothetical protein